LSDPAFPEHRLSCLRSLLPDAISHRTVYLPKLIASSINERVGTPVAPAGVHPLVLSNIEVAATSM